MGVTVVRWENSLQMLMDMEFPYFACYCTLRQYLKHEYMPFSRAAFQYGVKMSDGRKTRRAGPKDEKAELDRQWQQIQNIMNKRKGEGYGDGGGKKPKY